MNSLPHHHHRSSSEIRRGFRITTTALVCSAALFLGACSSTEPAATGPEVEDAVGVTVDAPRITLHDVGSGELRQLHYAAAPETSDTEAAVEQDAVISVSDGFTQSLVPAAELDPTAPVGEVGSTMKLPVSASVTAVEPTGEEPESTASRAVSLEVGQPSFTDAERAADINSTAGFTMGVQTDDRGQQSSLHFSAPVEATDTGRVLMEQYLLKYASLPVVFPVDEVGVGASWSVDSRVSGESALLQTATFTITGMRGDVVDLEVSLSQRPSLGAIDITQDTAGVTADTPAQLTVLNANTTTSTGALSVDLNQPVPTSGEVSWTTRVVYGSEADDLRVVQDSTSAISFGN